MIREWVDRILGTATQKEANNPADPEDLIALGRVSVALETQLNYEPAEEAAVAFDKVETATFDKAIEEVEAVIRHEDGTKDADIQRTDSRGTKWIVLEDDVVDSLTANLQYSASAMQSVGRSSRLLAAVMAFSNGESYSYLIYSFNRGKFYPFVPIGSSERDRKEEEKMANVIKDEIDVEEDRSYWYPLWPDKPGSHPWE